MLPSDPPLGLVYGLPADLSAATAVFDTATSPSGPVTLEYLRFDPRGDAYLTFDAERDEDVAGGLFVIDDLASVDPWAPRGVKVRGTATLEEARGGMRIRIVPEVVWSWHLNVDAEKHFLGIEKRVVA